ncbi:hypothetical protein LCGC14_2946130 [marine sediment metagenome]|uniref:Uncharacterized protein n=1 Tax=marine sediment metagenome TaxID=412755 RepID=A0A0F9A7S7_9ZZZZ
MSGGTQANQEWKERYTAEILDALTPWNTPESGIYQRLFSQLVKLDKGTLSSLGLGARVVSVRRDR